MKHQPPATLRDVQAVYSGPEGRLWELVMGEQIHIGGLQSSMDLANRANIAAGSTGVDLCCCTGAGMRFLLRFREVERMAGVDATEHIVELGRRRCAEEGLDGRATFTLADACDSGLPAGMADFVWGEDAWCYVTDKPRLIAEAVRLARPGGCIAFTDWVVGPDGMPDDAAARFLSFMKFPNMQTLAGYRDLLAANGCEVLAAHDTGRFAPCVDLYLNMLATQLTYDALKIIGFDMPMMEGLRNELGFTRTLAHNGSVVQGLFVARKAG